jgi:hypothetical protein
MAEPVTTGNITVEQQNYGNQGLWRFSCTDADPIQSVDWLTDYDVIIHNVIFSSCPAVDAGKVSGAYLAFKLPQAVNWNTIALWYFDDQYSEKGFKKIDLHLSFPAGTEFVVSMYSTSVLPLVPVVSVFYERLNTTINLPGKECGFVDWLFRRC